jgi:hypothetical protein
MNWVRFLISAYLILSGATAFATSFDYDLLVSVEEFDHPIRCTSGALDSNPVKGSSIDFDLLDFKLLDDEENCLFYRCEPIAWNGKVYDTVFSAENIHTFLNPVLTLVGVDSLGPRVHVKEVQLPDLFVAIKDILPELRTEFFFQENSSLLDGVTDSFSLEKSLQIAIQERKLPSDFPVSTLELYLKDQSRFLRFREKRIQQCHNRELLSVFQRETQFVHSLQRQLISLPTVQRIKKTRDIFGADVLVSFLQVGPVAETENTSLESIEAEMFKNHLEFAMADCPTAFQSFPLSQSAELVSWLNSLPSIPWDHVEDGCFSRAHVVADKLQGKGIRTQKIWIEGRISPKAHPEVRWNYHVAVLIDVSDPLSGDQKRVIDFALAPNQLLTIEEWLSLVTVRDPGGLVQGSFPFPSNRSYFGQAMWATSSAAFLYRNMSFKDRRESHQEAHQANQEFEQIALSRSCGAPTVRVVDTDRYESIFLDASASELFPSLFGLNEDPMLYCEW